MLIAAIVISVLVWISFLADLYTTKRASIDRPTMFHEGNPIMGRILNLGGFRLMVAIKLLLAAGITYALVSFPEPVVLAAGVFAFVSTGYVAWRNKRLIVKSSSGR
jgi:hypothetical protein